MQDTSIAILIIGPLSMATNGVLLVIMLLDPLKKFRTTTNYLILSLTVSDFITGAAGTAFAFEEAMRSRVVFGVLWSTIFSSFLTILLMSCERFVIVLQPLRAKSLITRHRIFLFITLNWVLCLILGVLLGHFRYTQQIYHILFVLFFCILTMMLVLVVLYIIIIRNIKAKAKFQKETICTRTGSIIRQQHRLTGVLVLLVTILLFTVIPYVIAAMVSSAYKIFGRHHDVPQNVKSFVEHYFPVELINFAVNPIIYAWRLPYYRKSLTHYLTKLPFISKKMDTRPEQRTRSMLDDESGL